MSDHAGDHHHPHSKNFFFLNKWTNLTIMMKCHEGSDNFKYFRYCLCVIVCVWCVCVFACNVCMHVITHYSYTLSISQTPVMAPTDNLSRCYVVSDRHGDDSAHHPPGPVPTSLPQRSSRPDAAGLHRLLLLPHRPRLLLSGRSGLRPV